MNPPRRDLRTWLYPPLLGPGILLAAITWPPYGTGVLFVLAALISGISHRSIVESQVRALPGRDDVGQHADSSPASTLDVAALGGLITVSLAALGSVSLPLTVLVAAVLVAGSRWARRSIKDSSHPLGRHLSPAGGTASWSEPTPPPAALDTNVARLSAAELCNAWRHSYPALQRTSDYHQRARLVTWRQALLDEIEKRDAEGLRAWLSADAQPTNSPKNFLRAPGPPEKQA